MASLFFRIMTVALMSIAGVARAQFGGGTPHLHAALGAETSAPRAGSTVMLAIELRPEAGWHDYWLNPGDAGVAPRVTWTLPRGGRAGELRYPAPQRLLVAGLMNFVYEGAHALLVPLDVPAGLAPGTRLPIGARLDYLVCSASLCVPEHATLATVLTVGDGAVAAADRARFDGWRHALPQPATGAAHFELAGGSVRLEVPKAGSPTSGAQPFFFPATKGMIDYAAPQTILRAGGGLRVAMKAAAGATAPARLEGVLALGDGVGIAISATAGKVAPGGVPLGGGGMAEGGGAPGFLLALGGALLGGMLLNLMPCVFPILSLKALGLARGGGAGGDGARSEAIAYTAGAVAACLALGAAILVLRAGGAAAGWAFQLQDPRMTLALFLLMSAIGLNLAGLFELPMLGGAALASGRGGAFAGGALAAVVATPCTGPFMAAALGAALLLPGAEALAVFGGLGLGLALPFLLIAFVPALQRLLPRPGRWMETFRHVLAAPMLATALWFAWLLGRQAGVTGMTAGLAAALLAGIALWWVGLRQARGASFAWAPALALLLAAPAFALVRSAPDAAAPSRDEPFSEAKLAGLRAAHRPVFVYLTADWCLTCKVNEAAAIDRAEVRAAFRRNGVAVLAGDWTRGDPAITQFLADQGRSGVPFYAFFPADGATVVLPQILTPGRLMALD